MNDHNSSESSKDTQTSADTTATPAMIVIGGLSSPQKVKRGGKWEIGVAAMLKSSNGGAFPGEPGGSTWSATASPSTSDIQGQSGYKLNGTITIPKVEKSLTVRIRVVSTLYGLSATKDVEVIPF